MLHRPAWLARILGGPLSWFLFLWICGVALTGLFVLPFHFLIAMAIRAP
jgi:hypothetical protein